MTGVFHEFFHCVSKLRAFFYPVLDSFSFKINSVNFVPGIICSQVFEETTVPGRE